MKKIQVLGPGCHNCERLSRNVDQAIRELNLTCEVEKVTDIMQIAKLGVMMPPALIIDGETKISGKVPSVAEIKKLIS